MTRELMPGELRTRFGAYLAEIHRCFLTDCHWALLHLLAVIPDICGGLEAPKSKHGARARSWIRRYITPPPSDHDWWLMRNALLHEGTTRLEEQQTGEKPTFFSFVGSFPDFPGPVLIEDGATERVIRVSLAHWEHTMLVALDAWFHDVETDPRLRAAVSAHIGSLAQLRPMTITLPSGVRAHTVGTSSTG